MAIGRLSRKTGVNVETVRYYERVGLLPKPARSEGGHRLYDEEARKRLSFIRRARELGFSLDEIRALLGLVDGGDYTCEEVRSVTLAHLDDVRRKIKDLKRLERTLADISSRCGGGAVPECPIVDALFDDDS
ncbi:MAG: helix-turn-helix domain-containing protein [Leptospirillia bacterium]